MNEDRRAVLEMLAAGKITADEADRLLHALERPAGEETPKPKAKYLHVVVDTDARRDSAPRVNIRVPMQLLRAGVKLASLVPAQAQARVNTVLHERGIDLSDIKPENLEEIVEQLGDVSVDVGEKVRIYCE
jgi:hypothetical protein